MIEDSCDRDGDQLEGTYSKKDGACARKLPCFDDAHDEAIDRTRQQEDCGQVIEGAVAKARSLGDDGYLEFLFGLVVDRTS